MLCSVTVSPLISAQPVSATSGCQLRLLLGLSMNQQAAISRMLINRPSFARESGRTNNRAATAAQRMSRAAGWRKAAIGKSNQTAPKAHAVPVTRKSHPNARPIEPSSGITCLPRERHAQRA